MAGKDKDYVVGKGRIYFAPFLPGTTTATAERYLGNTPELTTTADMETLDHYDSDQGLNVKDESITIENNLTGALVTDNISVENVGMFFGGDPTDQVQTSATGLSHSAVATRGRYIQLGEDDQNPTGLRHVNNVTMTVGGVSKPLANNVEVDLERGRVYIETDAPDIVNGAALVFTFDVQASTRQVVLGNGDEVRGALRFLSANPVGSQRDYYWPYVKLTPNGDFALKSDEWQQIPFSFEVLKLTGRARVYIEGASRLPEEANAPATGVPTITGTAQVGQTLTAVTSAIDDPDGLGAFSYQWLRAGATIAGATSSTYVPVTGDIGSAISVRVSFTDGAGHAEAVTSAGTSAVIAA
jgi:hypothetical protein